MLSKGHVPMEWSPDLSSAEDDGEIISSPVEGGGEGMAPASMEVVGVSPPKKREQPSGGMAYLPREEAKPDGVETRNPDEQLEIFLRKLLHLYVKGDHQDLKWWKSKTEEAQEQFEKDGTITPFYIAFSCFGSDWPGKERARTKELGRILCGATFEKMESSEPVVQGDSPALKRPNTDMTQNASEKREAGSKTSRSSPPMKKPHKAPSMPQQTKEKQHKQQPDEEQQQQQTKEKQQKQQPAPAPKPTASQPQPPRFTFKNPPSSQPRFTKTPQSNSPSDDDSSDPEEERPAGKFTPTATK